MQKIRNFRDEMVTHWSADTFRRFANTAHAIELSTNSFTVLEYDHKATATS